MRRSALVLVRSSSWLMAATLAAVVAFPGRTQARDSAPAAGSEIAPAPALRALGSELEGAGLLSGSERVSALERLDQSVATLLKRDLDADERAQARFLAGEIRYRLGDYKAAGDAFERAEELSGRGPFADDAGFAAIAALEASGRDAEAAREWPKWEKRYPQSPLLPEARFAQVWNALRRGETGEGRKKLSALLTACPWMQGDARVALARGTALYLEKKPAEALEALGNTRGVTVSYLRALCYGAQGALLKSAALFQEVAETRPESPLRDHALLGKANAFLTAGDYRSAAEEFARVAERASDPKVRAESELRAAASVFMTGAADSSLALLRGVVERHAGTDVAARGQFLVGEVLAARGKHQEAIVELNRVLSTYFQHSVAASAQYRVGRCLDALGRHGDATGAYQAVVSGYPLEPEAPAAAYLAGVGLLTQGRPAQATPYFQLVLDRYAPRDNRPGLVVFASPQHQELVEAALCLLEYSYHRTGNLGQLSGAPHLLLGHMPPSRSPWRAYALLIDADASAAQGRYSEAQASLETLTRELPDHPVGASAGKLLAWTYARQGNDSLAIATEERLLARYGASGNDEIVGSALLDIAHQRFNQKRYREAAGGYEEFLRRFPGHARRLLARYQAGLCYLRLNRAGDALDRWEAIVRDSAGAAIAERAWARVGDLYFQAERYEDARRAYRGLLEHFSNSSAASLAMLRLAQCEYNAGRDAAALEAFSNTIARFPGTPAAREAARGTELALYRLSQSPKATQVLAKLVEQFPTSAFAADAQFQIARRHYEEKRFREAADAFRRVVSQFPGYSGADQAQFLMADSYARVKATAEAQNAYEQFLSFFPNSELVSTVSYRLGLLQFEAKDYMRAALAFTRALTDSATKEVRSASRYNLALCHRLLGQTAEARSELERYRADFPGDERAADVALALGDLSDAAGLTREAAREFEAALASRPRGALAVELYFRLGRCREQLGDRNAALRAFQQAAASSDRDHPFRLSALARCAALYEAKRDYAKALAAYRDIMNNAKDRELVAAAAGRVSQLETGSSRR